VDDQQRAAEFGDPPLLVVAREVVEELAGDRERSAGDLDDGLAVASDAVSCPPNRWRMCAGVDGAPSTATHRTDLSRWAASRLAAPPKLCPASPHGPKPHPINAVAARTAIVSRRGTVCELDQEAMLALLRSAPSICLR
jgi:hypothetical protein